MIVYRFTTLMRLEADRSPYDMSRRDSHLSNTNHIAVDRMFLEMQGLDFAQI